MKKVLFILLIVFSFMCFACDKKQDAQSDDTNKQDTPNENVDDVTKVDIDEYLSAVVISDSVTSDIILPVELLTKDGKKIALSWKSDNDAITSSGKVTRQNDDVLVTLTVTASIDGETKTKTITVKVLKEEVALDIDSLFEEAIRKINIPSEITKDITLLNSVTVSDTTFSVSYVMDSSALEDTGKVTLDEENDVVVKVKAVLTCGEVAKEYDLAPVTVLSMKTQCERVASEINIPDVVEEDLNFACGTDVVKVEWNSSKTSIISNTGKLAYISGESSVKITCTIYVEQKDKSYFIDKEYNVTAKSWKPEVRLDIARINLTVPSETTEDLYLPYKMDYDVYCQWTSSDDTVISPVGYVYQQETDQVIILFVKLYTKDSDKTLSMSYTVKVPKMVKNDEEEYFKYHNLVVRAKDFVTSKFNGLVYDEASGRVKLASGALEGSYESKVYNIHDAYEIVGSYACLTSKDATCECGYSLKVGSSWSKYFTYGVWGLGKENYYYNSEDSLVKMDVDEIMVKNGATASAVKFKFTLRRNNASTESPALSMVACCLFINDYTYRVDESQILPAKDWDVPKLYQHDVPNIGSVICSPTTTTMLLKFMGMSFKDKGYTYEHEYIARMAADPGHNSPTYGNWSYNMITAGALGATAYVARIYSVEELKYHLCTVGPIGASIRGNFGIYTTGGHLIVVRGYRDENGSTTIICNDPNVKGVYYEVSLSIFLGAWRNMAYIFEY